MFNIKQNEFYVVAEIANAAQGVYEDNFKLIDLAKESGANAVKFQFYKYDCLAATSYSKYEIYENTFYTEEQRNSFVNYATKLGLDIWVDIFDEWGLEVATKNISNIKCIKIPPTIILDNGLVNEIVKLDKPIALGVGGYTDEDIDFVLNNFNQTNNQILLMYGFQGFPAQLEDTVLTRIPYLRERYGYEIGFADHVDANTELALSMPEYAFFAGARIIEKHITLDRSAKGFDYYSALEQDEFSDMIKRLSTCAKINGTGEISSGQKDYLLHATRAVLKENKLKGDFVFREDLNFKRTDNPKDYFPNEAVEKFPYKLSSDLSKDDGINENNSKSEPVVGVVIARMASSRLERKALLELNNVPAIKRCLDAASASKKMTKVVFATSTNTEDDDLFQYVNGVVDTYRGSDNDPGLRIFEAANLHNAAHVLRITGDTPLLLPDLVDDLIGSHLSKSADYSYVKNSPLGVSAEIFTIESIKYVLEHYETDGNSEYLSLFFKNNEEIFNINHHVSELIDPDCINYRFNLDYPEDYEVINRIFELKADTKIPYYSKEFFHLSKSSPDLMSINSGMEKKYEQGKLKEHLLEITTRKAK